MLVPNFSSTGTSKLNFPLVQINFDCDSLIDCKQKNPKFQIKKIGIQLVVILHVCIHQVYYLIFELHSTINYKKKFSVIIRNFFFINRMVALKKKLSKFKHSFEKCRKTGIHDKIKDKKKKNYYVLHFYFEVNNNRKVLGKCF